MVILPSWKDASGPALVMANGLFHCPSDWICKTPMLGEFRCDVFLQPRQRCGLLALKKNTVLPGLQVEPEALLISKFPTICNVEFGIVLFIANLPSPVNLIFSDKLVVPSAVVSTCM